jgi:hypothetical protein
MFEVRCPKCQRRFINEVNSFAGLKCCKQALPAGEPFKPVEPSHKVHVYPSELRKPRSLPVVCVHRGDQVGVADCGCNGPRAIYQCSKLIRPTATVEPAYCWSIEPIKYNGIILSDGSKISSYDVPRSEIVECSLRRCELFEPKRV